LELLGFHPWDGALDDDLHQGCDDEVGEHLYRELVHARLLDDHIVARAACGATARVLARVRLGAEGAAHVVVGLAAVVGEPEGTKRGEAMGLDEGEIEEGAV